MANPPIHNSSLFVEINNLFKTPSLPKNIQSYQLIQFCIVGLQRYGLGSLADKIALDLLISVFQFQEVTVLRHLSFINAEMFVVNIVKAIRFNTLLDFSADPFNIQGLPTCLKTPVKLKPLSGVNNVLIEQFNNSESVNSKWILTWAHTHPQRTDTCLFFINTDSGGIWVLPTYPSWIFADFFWVCRFSLPLHAWANQEKRSQYYSELEPADQIALGPSHIPIHFGHYLQNNLFHLSRLEELGVAQHVDIIYRSKMFDYFTNDQEKLFFSSGVSAKFAYSEHLESIYKESLQNKVAVISSKGSSIGKLISKNFNANCNALTASNDGSLLDCHSVDDLFRICIGVRGGTRMALNLFEYIQLLCERVHLVLSKNIMLVIDGMSISALNNQDTTALLSTDVELAIGSQFATLQEAHDYICVKSVIYKTQMEQLLSIAKCQLAISGFGTSTFKYMDICNIPTIVHGARDPLMKKHIENPPVHLFLGNDCVSAYEDSPDPNRKNYYIDCSLAIKKSLEFISSVYPHSFLSGDSQKHQIDC